MQCSRCSTIWKSIKKLPGKLVFDDLGQPLYNFPINGASLDKKDCMDLYPDAEDIFPNWMPETLESKVRFRAYVDVGRSATLLIMRSHSGIIIYMDNEPIIWYIKRHNTVNSLSFGSKFVALRITVDMI